MCGQNLVTLAWGRRDDSSVHIEGRDFLPRPAIRMCVDKDVLGTYTEIEVANKMPKFLGMVKKVWHVILSWNGVSLFGKFGLVHHGSYKSISIPSVRQIPPSRLTVSGISFRWPISKFLLQKFRSHQNFVVFAFLSKFSAVSQPPVATSHRIFAFLWPRVTRFSSPDS